MMVFENTPLFAAIAAVILAVATVLVQKWLSPCATANPRHRPHCLHDS